MRIGELARRSGVSERSLRYYEQQGLLSAQRTPGGHREYPDEAVERVALVQKLFAAGLCSAKIVQLLPCLAAAQERRPGVVTPRLVAELTAERRRIDRMIDDLLQSRAVLDEVISSAAEVAGTATSSAHSPTAR